MALLHFLELPGELDESLFVPRVLDEDLDEGRDVLAGLRSSRMATYLRMTPCCSSLWMRSFTEAGDSPTRRAISA